jgi:hypothetical protein
MKWLGRLSHQTLTVEARVHALVTVGFVVHKVALRQVFLRVLQLPPVNIITTWLSILICHVGDEQYVHWWLKFRDSLTTST